MTKNYVNLTNGIECITSLDTYGYIRIQSTACEQKRWDFILQELDYSFLMDLALGHHVIIYDMSNKRETPRAIWQGLEWIQYALNRRWFGITIHPHCRGNDTSEYFSRCYAALENRTKCKLDYFKRYLRTDKLLISSRTGITTHDGNYSYYVDILTRIEEMETDHE